MSKSKANIISQTSNSMHVRYDRKKIFLGSNRYLNSEPLLNATGGELEYEEGTLLGRISATGKVVPVVSTATDGSQKPLGVLAQCVTLAGGAETNVSVCIEGSVLSQGVILDAGDTLETVIDGVQLKDLIISNTAGIVLLEGIELTRGDNQ